jgi:uncharacterized protein YgbK (DUF1537 family)
VVDAVTENDLGLLALALEKSEAAGKRFIYRVAPPFVRARIGQGIHDPIEADEVFQRETPKRTGGLVVVGSHVAMTTLQLEHLESRHALASFIEIDVELLLGPGSNDHIAGIVERIVTSIADHDVILQTSRTLVSSTTPEQSLEIARRVSAGVVEVVQLVLERAQPRFVVAKGGITSSDVASQGLEIHHAIVRGPMLPGIVSLWEPVDGKAIGIPYVVFAGNVGGETSLLAVVQKLSAFL